MSESVQDGGTAIEGRARVERKSMKQEEGTAMLPTGLHGQHGNPYSEASTFALARAQGQMQLPWGTEGEVAGAGRKGNGPGSKGDSARVSRSQRACDACR